MDLALAGPYVVSSTWVWGGGLDETWVEREPRSGGPGLHLATLSGKGRSLAPSSDFVLMSRVNEPDLVEVPLDGGPARVLLRTSDLPGHGSGSFAGVALMGTDAVVAQDTGHDAVDDAPTPSLWHLSGDAGAPRAIGSPLGVEDVIVDGPDVTATFCATAIDYPYDGGVLRIPLGGGAAHILARRQVAGDGACPGTLAVGERDIFFSVAAEIRRVPKAGGPVSTIYRGPRPQALACAGTSVYVAVPDRILVASQQGGPWQTVVAATRPVSLAIDERTVYWLDEGGAIGRTPRVGHAVGRQP